MDAGGEEGKGEKGEEEGGGGVLLMPNATTALRSVLETLVRCPQALPSRGSVEVDKKGSEGEKVRVGVLEPIYGATRKMITEYLVKNYDCEAIPIRPLRPEGGERKTKEGSEGEEEYSRFCKSIWRERLSREGASLFEEELQYFIPALNNAYEEGLDILICDHIASQTGRCLPLMGVVEWCREKGVTLVVDGTGVADFFSLREMCQKRRKDVASTSTNTTPVFRPDDGWPDYYVLSTHKWLGNSKTCAIVRVGEGAPSCPLPVGISFGYDSSLFLKEEPGRGNLWNGKRGGEGGKGVWERQVNAHLWVGMTDYVPFVTLAVAVGIYLKAGKGKLFGKEVGEKGREGGLGWLLERGLKKAGMTSMLTGGGEGGDSFVRVVTTCPVLRTEGVKGGEGGEGVVRLQEVMDDMGIRVSVKEFEGWQFVRLGVNSYISFFDFEILSSFLGYNGGKRGGAGERRWEKGLLSRKEGEEMVKREIEWRYVASQKMVDCFFSVVRPLLSSPSSVPTPSLFLISHLLRYCAWGIDCSQVMNKTLDDISLETTQPWITPLPQDETEAKQIILSLLSSPSPHHLIRTKVVDAIRSSSLSLPLSLVSFHGAVLSFLPRLHHLLEKCIETMHNYPLAFDSSCLPSPSLPRNPFSSACFFPLPPVSPPQNKLLWRGKKTDPSPFFVSQYLVSNQEYLSFFSSSSYSDPRWWSSSPSSSTSPSLHPPRWVIKPQNHYRLRVGAGGTEEEMRWEWPIEVTLREATAFCRWKNEQLFREEGGKKGKEGGNWEVSLMNLEQWKGLVMEKREEFGDGRCNTALREFGSPSPVNFFGSPLAPSPLDPPQSLLSSLPTSLSSDIYDLEGNVWQHCTPTSPLPLDDISLPVIEGRDSLLVGGSWATVWAQSGQGKQEQGGTGGNRGEKLSEEARLMLGGFRYVVCSKEGEK